MQIEAIFPFTDEVTQKIKDRKIKNAILKDGTKVRIFMAEGGYICQFKKGSSTRGYALSPTNIQTFIQEKEKAEDDRDKKEYKIISKFLREAKKATFTNSFIQECLALPDTFEKWVAEGKKSAYQYGITTGCKITGNLVSIDSLSKYLNSHYVERLKEAIKNKTTFSTGRFKYMGYDGSISIEKGDNGEIRGFLSKEYKDCGNGYYYLLINDEYFIGYDVD
jgi:hypothetical protein